MKRTVRITFEDLPVDVSGEFDQQEASFELLDTRLPSGVSILTALSCCYRQVLTVKPGEGKFKVYVPLIDWLEQKALEVILAESKGELG